MNFKNALLALMAGSASAIWYPKENPCRLALVKPVNEALADYAKCNSLCMEEYKIPGRCSIGDRPDYENADKVIIGCCCLDMQGLCV